MGTRTTGCRHLDRPDPAPGPAGTRRGPVVRSTARSVGAFARARRSRRCRRHSSGVTRFEWMPVGEKTGMTARRCGGLSAAARLDVMEPWLWPIRPTSPVTSGCRAGRSIRPRSAGWTLPGAARHFWYGVTSTLSSWPGRPVAAEPVMDGRLGPGRLGPGLLRRGRVAESTASETNPVGVGMVPMAAVTSPLSASAKTMGHSVTPLERNVGTYARTLVPRSEPVNGRVRDTGTRSAPAGSSRTTVRTRPTRLAVRARPSAGQSAVHTFRQGFPRTAARRPTGG